MVAPLIPIAGILGGTGLGFLFGKVGGGSNAPIASGNELFTKKTQNINTRTNTTTNTSSFTDARSFSLILDSPSASITTKKDIATSQIPSVSVIPSIIPNQGGTPSFGGSAEQTGLGKVTDIIIIGGLLTGGIILVSNLSKKKK